MVSYGVEFIFNVDKLKFQRWGGDYAVYWGYFFISYVFYEDWGSQEDRDRGDKY